MKTYEINRKFNQMDQDIRDLHAIVHGIAVTQRRHGERLDEIAIVLDDHTGQLRTLNAKVDHLETRFDGLETRFDGLETRFDGLETKVDRIIDLLGDRQG